MSRGQIGSKEAEAILEQAIANGHAIGAFQNGLDCYGIKDTSEFLISLAEDLSDIRKSVLDLICDVFEQGYACAMWYSLDILLALGSQEGHEHCALAANDFANAAVKLGCIEDWEVETIRDEFQRYGTPIDELAGTDGAAFLDGAT